MLTLACQLIEMIMCEAVETNTTAVITMLEFCVSHILMHSV